MECWRGAKGVLFVDGETRQYGGFRAEETEQWIKGVQKWTTR